MDDCGYNMSFTTGGLFLLESVKLATLFLELGDWDAVRTKVATGNLLQTRTQATFTRIYREISFRLKTLSPDELNFLVGSSRPDQVHILWIAICRHHKFIGEFASEELRERCLSLNFGLSYDDFEAFFNRKSEWHRDLDSIKPATRRKLKQVLFRMLHEADLLTSDHTINPPILSRELLRLMRQNGGNDIDFFPVLESNLKGNKR